MNAQTMRFSEADGPVRTLYPGTKLGERLAAERNARLLTDAEEQPVGKVRAADSIGQVPRPAKRAKGSCRRCQAPFDYGGTPNRLYCDAHSSGVQRRGHA